MSTARFSIWSGIANGQGLAALLGATSSALDYLVLDCPHGLFFRTFSAGTEEVGRSDSGRAFGPLAYVQWRRVDDVAWLEAMHEGLTVPAAGNGRLFSVVMTASGVQASVVGADVSIRPLPDLEALSLGEPKTVFLFGTPLRRADGWWWYEARVGRPRRYPVDPPADEPRWRAAVTLVPHLDAQGAERILRWEALSIVDVSRGGQY